MTGDRFDTPALPMRRLKRIPYEDVARIVREWPTMTGYGPHIAQVYGIPVSSAHRWINEARRRGFLPDGDIERPCPACKGTGLRTWGGKRDLRERS